MPVSVPVPVPVLALVARHPVDSHSCRRQHSRCRCQWSIRQAAPTRCPLSPCCSSTPHHTAHPSTCSTRSWRLAPPVHVPPRKRHQRTQGSATTQHQLCQRRHHRLKRCRGGCCGSNRCARRRCGGAAALAAVQALALAPPRTCRRCVADTGAASAAAWAVQPRGCLHARLAVGGTAVLAADTGGRTRRQGLRGACGSLGVRSEEAQRPHQWPCSGSRPWRRCKAMPTGQAPRLCH